VAIGIPAVAAATRLISSTLYGIKPTDPETALAVALGMLLTGFGAAFVPARRATRIDPLEALRQE